MFPTLPHSLQRIVRFVRKERRPQSRRRAQQPRLLVLEDRALLSTFTVTSSADSATQNHTLRYAVNHAQSGDTIELTAAIKNPIVLTLGELLVSQSVTIESVPARTPTISGGGTSRVFEISAGANVTPDNLNIIDGNGDGTDSGNAGFTGGAILNFGTLTVDSSTLSGNSCFLGGAIFNFGTMTINSSTLSGNSSNSGAIFNLGTLTVSGSTLSDNTARFSGGGIENAGTMTVSGSTFQDNHARFLGGGIHNVAIMTVQDSSFTDNSADSSGGAISTGGTESGTASVSGCVFTGNSASQFGGGIVVVGGVLTLVNDTFADNTSDGNLFGPGEGGALFGPATVIGCTITNNTAVQGGGIANALDFGDLSVGTSTFSGNTPDDIFGVYTDLGGNTF